MLITTFDYVRKRVFFSGTFIRMMVVRYDIVLHVKLNNSKLTETLKTVKNSNMLKKDFFLCSILCTVPYRTVPVQSNNFYFPNQRKLNVRLIYEFLYNIL